MVNGGKLVVSETQGSTRERTCSPAGESPKKQASARC